MSEVSRRKPRFAIGEPEVHRGFALNFVRDVSIAERDVNIVVAMTMHERRSMGRNFNLEDAEVVVFQSQVVRGFRGDFDFSRGLRSQERNQQKEEQEALHERGL